MQISCILHNLGGSHSRGGLFLSLHSPSVSSVLSMKTYIALLNEAVQVCETTVAALHTLIISTAAEWCMIHQSTLSADVELFSGVGEFLQTSAESSASCTFTEAYILQPPTSFPLWSIPWLRGLDAAYLNPQRDRVQSSGLTNGRSIPFWRDVGLKGFRMLQN